MVLHQFMTFHHKVIMYTNRIIITIFIYIAIEKKDIIDLLVSFLLDNII